MPYQKLSTLGYDINITNRLAMGIEADLLVLQRQHADGILTIVDDYKKRGGKVIYELDDNFHDIPKNNPAGQQYPKGGKELKNIETFLGLADLMTVSTQGLADYYKKFTKEVVVCKNAVDFNHFPDFSISPRDTETFRLGWAGSGTHYDDFLTVIKPITQLMEQYKNLVFAFVGMDYRTMFPSHVRKRMEYCGHTFPVDTQGKPLFHPKDGDNAVYQYYKLLKESNFHAAIAPILPVEFNRCKSYIKLLEYSGCGIPYVATGFGPYLEYVRQVPNFEKDKQIGLLASQDKDWKNSIKSLIESEDLRQKLAKNNYDFAQKNHSIQKQINQWVEALKKLDIEPGDYIGQYEEKIYR